MRAQVSRKRETIQFYHKLARNYEALAHPACAPAHRLIIFTVGVPRRSVAIRRFCVINDEHVYRSPRRLQFQTELFPHR